MQVLQAHIISTAVVFGRNSVAYLISLTSQIESISKCPQNQGSENSINIFGLPAIGISDNLTKQSMMRPGYDKYFG